jgi:hypothetical protein
MVVLEGGAFLMRVDARAGRVTFLPLNPKPQTLSPKPQTLNPKAYALSPMP